MTTITHFSGEIKSDPATLDTFSRDASVFRIIPSSVAVPKTVEDVLALVAHVRAQRAAGNTALSLTARAAGTCMSGGPLTESMVVSFTEHINKILEIGTDYISVEPGAFYRDVETATLAKNLVFPSYPASKALCAMGGILNNNSGGEKTLKYGKTIDYVREVDMVCSDGQLYTFKEFTGAELKAILENDQTFFGDVHRAIYKLVQDNKTEIAAAEPTVTKSSAGYYLWSVWDEEKQSLNLAKLICGAQGTLGITTRMTLGLVPVAPFVRTVVLFADKVSSLPKIVHTVLKHKPESLEMYDDHTFKIGMKFLPDIAKRMGGNILTLGLKFIPEFLMMLRGGIPKVVIIAEFTGMTQTEVDTATEIAYADIQALVAANTGITARNIHSFDEAQKYWTFRRESFNLLRSKLHGSRTAPFIEDVVIHADDFPAFMPEFQLLLDKYKLIYTIVGHVGDGHLHVIPLMTLKEDVNVEIVKTLSDEVYALTAKYKGSITGEHNDGLIRTPFLHYMFNDKVLGLFKQVKTIFDPENIFNPHKKVDVTWEEAMTKIDRTV